MVTFPSRPRVNFLVLHKKSKEGNGKESEIDQLRSGFVSLLAHSARKKEEERERERGEERRKKPSASILVLVDTVKYMVHYHLFY